MKKTVKFLSLLLALGLIAGCNANKPSEGPKSEDKSVESSKESKCVSIDCWAQGISTDPKRSLSPSSNNTTQEADTWR